MSRNISKPDANLSGNLRVPEKLFIVVPGPLGMLSSRNMHCRISCGDPILPSSDFGYGGSDNAIRPFAREHPADPSVCGLEFRG